MRQAQSWAGRRPKVDRVSNRRYSFDVKERPVPDPQHEPAVISVMLIVGDAEAAVAWYKRALGATELWNLGGVAGLEIEGAPFFLHEANPSNPVEDSADRIGVTSTRIELFVDDPDGLRERAIAAGA